MNKYKFVILLKFMNLVRPILVKRYHRYFSKAENNIYTHKNWTTYLDTETIINILKYKDNRWNHIKNISKLMWNDFYKLPFFQYNNKEILVNNKCSEDKIIKKDNHILCKSSNTHNDWIFLMIPLNEHKSELLFHFKAIIHNPNTEFQVAFNYQSIGKRYRFNLVNNKKINFDIVYNGFFINIAQKDFSLEMKKIHDFQLIQNNKYIQYIIDNKVIMNIEKKHNLLRDGNIAIILWDSANSNINVELSDFNILI